MYRENGNKHNASSVGKKREVRVSIIRELFAGYISK